MREDAQFTGRCAKLCWTILHFIVLLCLIVTPGTCYFDYFHSNSNQIVEGKEEVGTDEENGTSSQTSLDDSSFHVWFSFICCILLFVAFFWTGGKDPGFAKRDVDIKKKIQEDSKAFIVQEGSSMSGRKVQSNQNNERRDIEAGRVTEEIPLHYCNRCKILQPMRTKHCFKCERCVERYDHHCFFLGNCVGKNNHRHFFIYLILQTFCCIYFIFLAIKGFKSQPDIHAWIARNYLILTAILLDVFLLPVPSILLFFHLYLVFTNQTTWERTKRNHITYLKDLPDHSMPFDRGCHRNLYNFFMKPDVEVEWMYDPHPTQTLAGKLCDNEHYSCF
eukprot:TRINITY_DN12980_c0_g1_i1.p1 TRINITY_DN12980_c0_g1~~TRINITY_DN12980_c0_g1_i1.p1  ORF type:complete len:333 (+),score=86.53 TRINITY_DN12980_c0_g1_i1:192-1190(+)